MRKNTIMYLASYSSIVQTFDKCKNLLKKLAPAPVSDVEGVGTWNNGNRSPQKVLIPTTTPGRLIHYLRPCPDV